MITVQSNARSRTELSKSMIIAILIIIVVAVAVVVVIVLIPLTTILESATYLLRQWEFGRRFLLIGIFTWNVIDILGLGTHSRTFAELIEELVFSFAKTTLQSTESCLGIIIVLIKWQMLGICGHVASLPSLHLSRRRI